MAEVVKVPFGRRVRSITGCAGRKDDRATIWTIGHSSADVELLVQLLQQFETDVLIDVRSVPHSRFSPQFNRNVLEEALRQAGRNYLHAGSKLGGRPDDFGLWLPNGKPDYIAMAQTDAFVSGLRDVMALAMTRRVGLMCSEEDPTHCHRTLLVGEQLAALGCAVLHIRHSGDTETQADVIKCHTGGQLALF